ncbi:asparaginase [Martelella endophytica]|uniref:Asparaginase n=1 Tax=Martelella endophytica TaxID=1486262 RepID=A0A0D5LTG0_MAREN|nr:asparaginase [Martelella endophytica]AJY47479.1 asparaginase [Martelella endophytica]
MANPVLVEVTRGGRVESRHHGMIAVLDAHGHVAYAAGDIDAAIFPRSACKAIQALPLVESGAADALGFTDREIALSASSHSGEDEHIALAGSMLAKVGRSVADLECGAHWSGQQNVLIHQARTRKAPDALCNNCSGKHAGFICACCHLGVDPKGYTGYEHPLQREIRVAMADVTGAHIGEDVAGIDGCAIPTYAVPVKALAQGFAKLVTGTGLSEGRAAAGKRILTACMAEPFYVAGTDRACTELMQAAPGRIFAKTGAEGVFCAALPEHGLGIALKCEDGATRAAEAMIAAVLMRYFADDAEVTAALEAMANRTLINWNGTEVGAVKAVLPH